MSISQDMLLSMALLAVLFCVLLLLLGELARFRAFHMEKQLRTTPPPVRKRRTGPLNDEGTRI